MLALSWKFVVVVLVVLIGDQCRYMVIKLSFITVIDL